MFVESWKRHKLRFHSNQEEKELKITYTYLCTNVEAHHTSKKGCLQPAKEKELQREREIVIATKKRRVTYRRKYSSTESIRK